MSERTAMRLPATVQSRKFFLSKIAVSTLKALAGSGALALMAMVQPPEMLVVVLLPASPLPGHGVQATILSRSACDGTLTPLQSHKHAFSHEPEAMMPILPSRNALFMAAKSSV